MCSTQTGFWIEGNQICTSLKCISYCLYFLRRSVLATSDGNNNQLTERPSKVRLPCLTVGSLAQDFAGYTFLERTPGYTAIVVRVMAGYVTSIRRV